MAAYLSARAAARRLGVSDKTVRQWVRSGRVVADTSGRSFRIDADRIADLAAELVASSRTEVAESAPAYDSVRRLEEHVADLRVQLEARTREVAELHTLLAQAQRALPEGRSSAEPLTASSDDAGSKTSVGLFRGFRWPWTRP